MNQNTIRKMVDRKRPVISIDKNEEPIVMLVRVSQACKSVGWSQAEINAAMSIIVFDGRESFVDSLEACIE